MAQGRAPDAAARRALGGGPGEVITGDVIPDDLIPDDAVQQAYACSARSISRTAAIRPYETRAVSPAVPGHADLRVRPDARDRLPGFHAPGQVPGPAPRAGPGNFHERRPDRPRGGRRP